MIASAEKVILEDVNISFPAGEVTAILVRTLLISLPAAFDNSWLTYSGTEWRGEVLLATTFSIQKHESWAVCAFQN